MQCTQKIICCEQFNLLTKKDVQSSDPGIKNPSTPFARFRLAPGVATTCDSIVFESSFVPQCARTTMRSNTPPLTSCLYSLIASSSSPLLCASPSGCTASTRGCSRTGGKLLLPPGVAAPAGPNSQGLVAAGACWLAGAVSVPAPWPPDTAAPAAGPAWGAAAGASAVVKGRPRRESRNCRTWTSVTAMEATAAAIAGTVAATKQAKKYVGLGAACMVWQQDANCKTTERLHAQTSMLTARHTD